ncbi:MAG TPA: hypothetical protein VHF92_11200, partial [Geodermatophilus sp.]|nr:hypothetical protein [Geodermatophilus sp.]
PLRAAGAMTLTLYTAHVLVLQTGVLEDHPAMQYLLLLVAPSLVFAVLWRRRRAQGPLEALVGRAADAARQAVLGSRAAPAGTGSDR